MTALAEQETDTSTTIAPRFSLAGVIGIIVTVVLIVCHGCHAGDHDDELSVPLEQEEVNHG